MWWTSLALLLAISVVVDLRSGPRAALGAGVLLSFLFPSWIVNNIYGTPIDLRVATALILLIWRLFDPREQICWWFNAGDWAIFVMFFVSVASDTCQDGFSISHFVLAFGTWSLPYIAGRLTIETVQDWRWMTGLFVVVALIFAVSSVAEATTHVNPTKKVFGNRPKDRAPQMMIRNGLKRAEGPTRHPIWFGMLQCLLLPWTLVAAARGLRGDGPLWWSITPICSVCGVLATMSRGPALAALAIPYFLCLFFWPNARRYLVGAGIAAVCAGFLFQPHLRYGLEYWDNSRYSTQAGKQIDVDGEKHQWTAMSHRWLVFSAYRRAISNAGLLGYGNTRTADFPFNVPLGPDAVQATSVFWTIDDEYLIILLRFGWFGLAAFAAICLTSMWHILQQSQFCDAKERLAPLAIAAALPAVMCVFLVEWMPSDYGFLFLWLCGAANGIRMTTATQAPSRFAQRSHRTIKKVHGESIATL
ncbi:MAG: O-antigen ligase protein [Schlesneria sp.]|nr:O-antigen ligase protein [Schlesneria sp.]